MNHIDHHRDGRKGEVASMKLTGRFNQAFLYASTAHGFQVCKPPPDPGEPVV
jgi:hypothetical protein